MKVVFISSVLNHHQIEFCDAMYQLLGKNFCFVSTMEMEEQRKNLKYPTFERSYALKMYTSETDKQEVEKVCMEADAVIFGVHLPGIIHDRLKNGKIVFLYRERIFKKAPSPYLFAKNMAYFAKEYWRFKSGAFYLLCASAYTLHDHKLLGMFSGKAFSWGYFPPCKRYDIQQLMSGKGGRKLKLFWAGRLIKLKNPMYLLDVAKRLRSASVDFCIDIVGNGELEAPLRAEIQEYSLHEQVILHGAMSQERVREYMERADIYLFTSNREEGFGAVLVEAMNSGCAVVASETAGATGLVIRDGKNGRIYKRDSCVELCEIILELAKNREQVKQLGKTAYQTITTVHNAEVAANRFIQVLECLCGGNELPEFKNGPMCRME